MPTDVNSPETAAVSKTSKKSTSATKLLQAAALAAVLVPLGSVAMESATIVCGFSGGVNGPGCTGEGFSGPRIFDFDQTTSPLDDYKIILDFGFGDGGSWEISVTDNPMTHLQFSERESLPGEYDCVDLVDPDLDPAPCRDFVFVASRGEVWDTYEFDFIWDYPSDFPREQGGFPNEPDPPGPVPGHVRILQNKGDPLNGPFTIDMCLAALTDPDFVPCDYDASAFDPRIGSGNDGFTTETIAWTAQAAAVPEPGILMLMGTGIAGILYRKRRRATKL